MAKMASLHLAISEMTVYISRILASSDYSTQLNQEYTSQQILTCVPTNHVDLEMGQNMDHDVWIHHRRLAALVAPLVLQRIRGIKTIKEAGTLHREEIIRTTGGQSADVLHVEWLVIW